MVRVALDVPLPELDLDPADGAGRPRTDCWRSPRRWNLAGPCRRLVDALTDVSYRQRDLSRRHALPKIGVSGDCIRDTPTTRRSRSPITAILEGQGLGGRRVRPG